MRRILTVLLSILIVIGICDCSSEVTKAKEGHGMYIEVAQLTNEEQSIVDLLGTNTAKHIFDFVLDDTVQSIEINTYKLVDDNWKLVSGGENQVFTDIEGRIVLSFDKIAEGLIVAIQSEHTGGATSYRAELDDESSSMGYATSALSDKTEITYEEEIPLVIQIITSKNEISSYNVEYFNKPDEYERFDYEHVYAITVTFSKNKLL